MITVHRDINQLPVFKNAALTIGTFDGVHTGHQQILKLLTNEANSINGESIIITFYPHPRKIVNDGRQKIFVLNTLEEKTALLNRFNIHHLVVIPFNEAFANQEADDYVKKFLVDKFNPKTIIIGYDHKFGKNRSGDYHLLEKLGTKYNFSVKEIPEHMQDQVTVSSTLIREALLNKDIEKANKLLGYHYFLEGIVVHGNKKGRTIGFPTANIEMDDKEKLIPANGVYAVGVTIEGYTTSFIGMMNIGTRPTVDGTNLSLEVNIFNFNDEIYSSKIKVHFYSFIRQERKFNNLEQLKMQLSEDAASAIAFIENNK